MFEASETIYSYTRAQAIEDGVLVDMTALAPDVCSEHYKHPIACTSEVYDIMERSVNNPKWSTSYPGIIHDILWMSRAAAQAPDRQTRLFPVSIAGIKRMIHLKMVCGPGDDGEPVLTVMLPGQD